MNERSSLLPKHRSLTDDSIPKFINQGKQRFKWAIPSQESEIAHRDRFFSIKICYFCMFLSAVSFTVTISSMWPFLQIIDFTTDTSFFGWIVSSFSLGQLISSPIFGYWANRIKCHKIPIIATLLITIFGNIIYFYLESIDEKSGFFSKPRIWMLVSRFIMGVGAACAAVIRSYVSSATNLEERTAALANISACQGLGFILGPVLQAALVPLSYPGKIDSAYFHLDMYSSPAFLSIIIYVVFLFLIIFKFNEYVVLESSLAQSNKSINGNSYQSSLNINDDENSLIESIRNLPPPDYVAITFTLILFFINSFIFSFYETMTTPLTIDMYAWSKKQATLYNGLMLGGFGMFAVIVVLISKLLARIFKEKYLMLSGYLILLLSCVSLLPWGHDYPSVVIPTIQPGHRNTTIPTHLNSTTSSHTTTDAAGRGCPLDYAWCLYTPIVKLFQFFIGFVLLVCGYSITNVMTFAIYSKLLGPKPQGTMMGILTSCGSLSRAVGPIVVSYLYGIYGPRVSFISLASIVILAILIILLTLKKYEAYKFV